MPQVGGFFLGLTGAATTGGVIGSAAFSGYLAGVAFAGSFTARLLASVALSALSTALAPKPKKPGLQTSVTQTGGQNPQSFIIGRYATAGTRVCPPMSHSKDGGSKNKYLTYVINLADMPGHQLERLIVNDEYVEIGDAGHPEYSADYGLPILGDYEGYAWIKTYDGTQTAADPMLLAKYGSYPERPWSADMIGTGVSYAILTWKFKRKVFSGLPAVRFEVSGIPLYDPRADSSVGGSGAQRWDDPSTWAPSENPVVQIYNILRGITLPDGSVWGGEAGAEDLPFDAWVAAANECDLPIEQSGGGTAPQYRASFEIRVAEEPAAVIEELLKVCSGRIAEVGGAWKIRVGAAPLPSLFITDDDIIVSSPQDYDPFPGLASTYNAVHASYPEPDSLWEAKDAPPRYNAGYEAADRNRRLVAELSCPAGPYAEQIQRIMQAYIEDERRFRRHGLTLPPEAAVLEPLDTLSWTSDRNGYSAKLFDLAEVADDLRTGLQRVGMREVDPADYDWQPTDLLPFGTGGIGVVRPDPEQLAGWAVAKTQVLDGGDAARRPALRLSWDGDVPDARGVIWELRRAGQPAAEMRGTTQDVEAGELILADGILPATAYEVRALLVLDRDTVWTGWLGATTDDIRLGAEDIDSTITDLIDSTNALAQQAFDRHDVAVAVATGTIAELRALLAAAYGPLFDVQTPLADLLAPMIPAQRSIEDALDDIAQQVGWGLSRMQQTDQRLADVGITVDPDTGEVKISAIEYLDQRVGDVSIELSAAQAAIELRATYAEVNQAISEALLDPTQIPIVDDLELRVSAAEVDIDALEGQIVLKADTTTVSGIDSRLTTAEADIDSLEGEILLKVDQTEFDAAETRLSNAEVQLETLDAPSITQTVLDTRAQYDELDENAFATFNQLWESFKSRAALREATAFAQSQILAQVNDDLSAEASARLALAADLGDAQAAILSEQNVRADADTALAADLALLEASVGANAASITTLQAAKVDGAGAVAAVEQEVSATYGSLTAMASATSFAEATADGISAGLILRLNGQNILEAVSVADGTDGPKRSFRLAADYVQITGITQIDNAVIQSLAVSNALIDNLTVAELQTDNYVPGVSGVRIGRDGVVEAQKVIALDAMADDTRSAVKRTYNEGDYASTGATDLLIAGAYWEVVALRYYGLNELTGDEVIYAAASVSARVDPNLPAHSVTKLRCQYQTRENGVWSEWKTLKSANDDKQESAGDPAWETFEWAVNFSGTYENIAMRVLVSPRDIYNSPIAGAVCARRRNVTMRSVRI